MFYAYYLVLNYKTKYSDMQIINLNCRIYILIFDFVFRITNFIFIIYTFMNTNTKFQILINAKTKF